MVVGVIATTATQVEEDAMWIETIVPTRHSRVKHQAFQGMCSNYKKSREIRPSPRRRWRQLRDMLTKHTTWT